MNRHVTIGKRKIGPGYPTYLIAEISANHNQSYDEAAKLVRMAKECGADAVKLQTYTADTMTLRSDAEPFRIGGGTLWDGKNLYDLYLEAYTPWEWQPKLKALADEIGIDLFSTPFDASAVDFLEAMNVPMHKIASFELTDHPLIQKVAATGKPIIMSTGMATLAEIEEAVEVARRNGARDLILLKCTSAYPALPESMNLRTIPHLADAFNVVAGLSDHTMGVAVPVAAVALGACVIEKHVTMSRDVKGPDSAFSLEPSELRELVASVRRTEAALGSVHYGLDEKEASSRVFRRSLFVAQDIQAGQPFTAANIRVVRPAHGLPPKMLPEVLGKHATCDLARGTPLEAKHIGL